MKKNLSVLLLIITTCQLPAQSNSHSEPFLTQFNNDYIKGILAGKREFVERYYDEQSRLMPEFQQTIIGRENALTYYAAFSQRFTVSDYNRTSKEAFDAGAQLIESGEFSTSLTLKSTQQKFQLKGKYITLWKRDEKNTWKLITEAWNYDHSITFADQLRFDQVPSVNIAFQPHIVVNSNISFEIAALNKLQEDVVTEHDAGVWKQYYTDDGAFLYSNNPIVKGRTAVDSFLDEHCKHLPIFEKLDIRTDKIDNLGNYVIEYASHVAIVKNGDWSGVATGKDVRIWRREPDHSLKIFRGIAMYD